MRNIHSIGKAGFDQDSKYTEILPGTYAAASDSEEYKMSLRAGVEIVSLREE